MCLLKSLVLSAYHAFLFAHYTDSVQDRPSLKEGTDRDVTSQTQPTTKDELSGSNQQIADQAALVLRGRPRLALGAVSGVTVSALLRRC